MQVNLDIPVGAVMQCRVYNEKTGELVRETPEFNNIVLTTGFTRMWVGNWITQLNIGTSSVAPAVSQTALQAYLASTTLQQRTNDGGIAEDQSYIFIKKTWRFNAGVATGNIAELGLGWSNTACWNRALVRDINGNPTTITVQADEYLDVSTEIRFYLPEQTTGSFNLLDKFGVLISTHSYVCKPCVSNPGTTWPNGEIAVLGNSNPPSIIYSGAIGANITTRPSGTSFNADATAMTVTRNQSGATQNASGKVGLNYGNGFAHRSVLAITAALPSLAFQFEMTPTITKTASQTLTYNVSLTFTQVT